MAIGVRVEVGARSNRRKSESSEVVELNELKLELMEWIGKWWFVERDIVEVDDVVDDTGDDEGGC